MQRCEPRMDLRTCPRCGDFMNKHLMPNGGARCATCGHRFPDTLPAKVKEENNAQG
jgi:hypothetical protein